MMCVMYGASLNLVPLQVKLGRYSNVPLNQLLCILCDKQQVEHEFHVLMVCDLYSDIRKSLVENIYNLWPLFSLTMLQYSSQNDGFFVMSYATMARHTEACRYILNRRHSLFMLSICF